MTSNVRWRSARRRSSEKSAKQMAREATPFTYQAETVLAASRRVQVSKRPYVVPPWLVKGSRVHYSSVIGEAPTKKDCLVLEDPFQVNGPKGTWVTIIDGHRGWVACEALSPAG